MTINPCTAFEAGSKYISFRTIVGRNKITANPIVDTIIRHEFVEVMILLFPV